LLCVQSWKCKISDKIQLRFVGYLQTKILLLASDQFLNDGSKTTNQCRNQLTIPGGVMIATCCFTQKLSFRGFQNVFEIFEGEAITRLPRP